MASTTEEKNLAQARLKRTLELWNKLQDRIEESLNAKELPANMLSAISKTLLEQFKMEKTTPEKAAESLEAGETTEETPGDSEAAEETFELPFPIDPTAEILEANLEEAAAIGEGENGEWGLAGRLQIES